jgi:hypothetical protein
MTERRVRFIAMAQERQRTEAANELELRRQTTESPVKTQEEEDERETTEKRADRERLDHRAVVRARIERLKQILIEYPEMKYACYCISMGLAFLFIQWLLVNGQQPWDEGYA